MTSDPIFTKLILFNIVCIPEGTVYNGPVELFNIPCANTLKESPEEISSPNAVYVTIPPIEATP